MIRVLVVDDHPAVRAGVVAALSGEPDIDIAGQVGSVEQALKHMRTREPDVALMELRLPGMGGVRGCTALRERHPRVRPIAITSRRHEGAMLEAFAAGARGLILKDGDPALMRHAVRTVVAGGTFVDPGVADRLVHLALRAHRARGPFGLTLAEVRVLERLPRGLSNAEIADELGITESTVKSHVGAILRKLDARDRAEAAAIARRRGLA